MPDSSAKFAIDRRDFLTAAGGALAAGALTAAADSPRDSQPNLTSETSRSATPAGSLRKIPIGVFDPVYEHLTIDEMLDKVSALGFEAMEIGTGGYPKNHHCPLDDLIADRLKAKAWLRKIETFASPRSVVTAIRFTPTPNAPKKTWTPSAKRSS